MKGAALDPIVVSKTKSSLTKGRGKRGGKRGGKGSALLRSSLKVKGTRVGSPRSSPEKRAQIPSGSLEFFMQNS